MPLNVLVTHFSEKLWDRKG